MARELSEAKVVLMLCLDPCDLIHPGADRVARSRSPGCCRRNRIRPCMVQPSAIVSLSMGPPPQERAAASAAAMQTIEIERHAATTYELVEAKARLRYWQDRFR